ncbi:protein AGENET DOMAIN (AGD)-CONTAINING P1-like isoform X1 [Phoenix dactylifera]|uniref:Protein AGENET DOMAIN (AGD)-CONTAINING P1-like isoform X1 n=1 Tax=Phoenix dactylifera TaxID=42345 RepID=A0A8B9A281_PHODC|nr:protein AGENET DOMAIN (AGD)-CONTAINING P1-like isoform X3 [Phoenix dactylifera]XP_038978149.1 protein AGENET DOMAIN (AGD)-CONTAINING P1-like isoform X1 [Phoenix dactylifera]
MEAGASSSRRQRQRPHGAFKEELSMEAGAGSRLRQRRGPYGAFKEVAEPLFSVGAQVEVSRESKNYGAAWLAATIVSMISKSIFLVDCKTPRAVTDRELSTEIVDAQHIRPPPPLALDDEDFRLHDVVEVLYHGGWSLGVVTQISNGSKYIVKLKHHEEEMEFNCFEMRSCQVWEDGQWISYSSQSMKQYSQEELKTRKRGRPAKKSIESEQAEDLPEQVAEEEHGKKEIEQSNQGRLVMHLLKLEHIVIMMKQRGTRTPHYLRICRSNSCIKTAYKNMLKGHPYLCQYIKLLMKGIHMHHNLDLLF